MPVFLLCWFYMLLETSILKTLAYFDLFDIPLSSVEVFKNLYGQREGDSRLSAAGEPLARRGNDTLHDVISALQVLKEQGKVENHEAFYALPGRGSDFVKNRKMRQAAAMEMLRCNRRWFSLLAAWPDVRAIAVCNNLAFLNAGPESDIDLFIVVKPGRLWVTRFVLAGLLALLGKRPRPGHEHGTICLSFFVATDNLDLSSVALRGEDIYLSYWLTSLLPIYDPDQLIMEMQRKNQALIFSQRNDEVSSASLWQAQTTGLAWRILRLKLVCLAVLLRPFARVIKRLQSRHFPASMIEAAKRGVGHVVINDSMLKFHTNDRREFYRQEWGKRFA